MNYPMKPHCAIICAPSDAGKTVFILDLLENEYYNNFEKIIFICPTITYNKSYQDREWLKGKNILLIDPQDNFDSCLSFLHEKCKGINTLFVIDDCANEDAMMHKRKALSKLAMSGRHFNHSVWVLTQSYKSVLRDYRKQIKWVALFYQKDLEDYDECLKENGFRDKEIKEKIRYILDTTPYAKLILNNIPPVSYFVHIPG